MNAIESLTDTANVKGQIMYTIFYIVAAVFLLVENVPAYVSGLLLVGAVLYNVWKIGRSKFVIEEDSTAEKAIAIGYLVVVGAGVLLALLYMSGMLQA